MNELSQAKPEEIDAVLATLWLWLHPMDEVLTPQEARAAMTEQNDLR